VTFPQLTHPIIQAPLAGGPSTPELAAAVSSAGGLGFVAAGYLAPAALREQVERARELTSAPLGVNVFYLAEAPVDMERVAAYVKRLQGDRAAAEIELGEPRFEDDWFAEKLELVIELGIPIVSFTFGCPPPSVFDRLHDAGAAAWATVTDLSEAEQAERAGADVLVAQGVEAGGHRGTFSDVSGIGELSTLALLQLLRRRTMLPLVAAGGIGDGTAVAAVLAAGAHAAQLGTAFMLTPEAGTAAAHRDALRAEAPTALTRAFTGRRARGIVNRFMTEHEAAVPAAYPHIHHVTSPLRRAARERGDAESINLWAGQTHELAQERPAGELVAQLAEEARQALEAAQKRLGSGL
jgi:nitronate monooxygenase